jgi:hypothetical protein
MTAPLQRRLFSRHWKPTTLVFPSIGKSHTQLFQALEIVLVVLLVLVLNFPSLGKFRAIFSKAWNLAP